MCIFRHPLRQIGDCCYVHWSMYPDKINWAARFCSQMVKKSHRNCLLYKTSVCVCKVYCNPFKSMSGEKYSIPLKIATRLFLFRPFLSTYLTSLKQQYISISFKISNFNHLMFWKVQLFTNITFWTRNMTWLLTLWYCSCRYSELAKRLESEEEMDGVTIEVIFGKKNVDVIFRNDVDR